MPVGILQRPHESGISHRYYRLISREFRIAAIQAAGADRKAYAKIASAGWTAGGRRSPNLVASQ